MGATEKWTSEFTVKYSMSAVSLWMPTLYPHKRYACLSPAGWIPDCLGVGNIGEPVPS